MSAPDVINSGFEGIAGCLFWFNVQKILEDKKVKGISYVSCLFFLIWSYWNIYYYYSLDQRFSLVASIYLAIPNTIWMYLFFLIKRKKSPTPLG